MVHPTAPVEPRAELPIRFDLRVATDGYRAYLESDACGGKILGVRPKLARELANDMLRAADLIEAGETAA